MSSLHSLKVFVNQRLNAAVQEIFVQFERTISEYEEEMERQRKLLDLIPKHQSKPQRADSSADIQQLMVQGTFLPEQQERSPSLDQEEPQSPHIKEEQEERWSSHEGEQCNGAEEEEEDVIRFPFTQVPVKSENDDESAHSSQRHQSLSEHREAEARASIPSEQMKTEADGENCGAPEPARNLDPSGHVQPATDDKRFETEKDDDWKDPLSCFQPEPEDSDDNWKETEEPHSALNTQNNEVPVSEGQRGFVCSECGKGFGLKRCLQRHMRCHTGEKPFSCPECGKRFGWKRHLDRHMACHTGEKPFSCSFCAKSFTRRESLIAHMRCHSGEKPYSCSVCNKHFRWSHHVVTHMRVHTGEKPYGCSECSKRFTEKGQLTRHMLVHTGEKPFSCNVCHKGFTRQSYVITHKCVGESSSSYDALQGD